MLTPEQIAAYRDQAGKITDPINNYLLRDLARRIADAGQLTSTAAYEVWRMQQMGKSQRQIKKELKKLLKVSNRELRKLLTQSAEVGYDFDIRHLPQVQAVQFEKNTSIQQIVAAAVALAQDDFSNITQTLGMVDPHGKALPLQEAYRSCTDFAFKQVMTGATDYNTAIRRATKNLAEHGVQVIEYESGVRTSLEAAVRRNIMGGLGLMQEQISQSNHDELGADGWELSAHANSAPDHEPFQGKQYTDAEYEALNGSLVRRISTLNCGHVAFPIILGVSEPQYTPEQLRQFREDNEKGVIVDGKHYTGYEVTQMQRKIERTIRKQKKRVLVDEATGDADKLLTDRIQLQRLNQEYTRFSKAAGLRTELERLHIAEIQRAKVVKTAPKHRAPVAEKKVATGASHNPVAETIVPNPNPAGVDVLNEYIQNATPGAGAITYEDGYKPGKHANEIKTANWLRDVFGCDIVLLNETNIDGQKMPDYLWRGKLWELKNPSTVNAADNRLRDGLKQILPNPGGIILDYGESDVSIEDVLKVADDRVPRGNLPAVDIMIVSKGNAVKIMRYKKKNLTPAK